MANCELVNSLSEEQFIAGGEQYFEFKIYDSESGTALDISDLNLTFSMNSITDPSSFNSISIVAEHKDINTFRVTIPSNMTKNLRGVYLQQPILIDYTGKELKPAQGRIIVTQSTTSN